MCDRVGLFRKKSFAPNIGKTGQNQPKIEFFEFIAKMSHQFFLVCSLENVYIIFCVLAHISYFGKNLILVILALVLSPSQITVFLSQLHLKKKLIK